MPPEEYILTVVTFLPALGGLMILLWPRGRDQEYRVLALTYTLATLVLSLFLWVGFATGVREPQFVPFGGPVSWIPQFGISYYLGVDGISLPLVLLTTLLTAVGVLAAWRAVTDRVKAFMATLLLLETGMIGVFASLDLFLFYVFWEVTLIPMYLLIGVWGHENRVYAAVKFILYTMAGSVIMLVAILVVYFLHEQGTGIRTFNLVELCEALGHGAMAIDKQYILFLAFAAAFAIKVPMFPFHTWLPDAHVEAPTTGSVILAGVLLKMGTYGFVRFCLPLFPDACQFYMPFVVALAIIGIIYGALVALVQPDVKKLVAYSSVSHLGFVMLGIFVMNQQGLQGAIIQMVNHGLSTGALFLIVGMLYERRHTRLIADYGGLWKQMPCFAAFFMIVCLSSIGLPGLNGFVGEFLILCGAFVHAHSVGTASAYLAPVLAATGVVLAAVYILWMFQRVMHGQLDKPENRKLPDLSAREVLVLLPIVLLIFWLGLHPKPFLDRTAASAQALVTDIHAPPPTLRPLGLPAAVERTAVERTATGSGNAFGPEEPPGRPTPARGAPAKPSPGAAEP